MRVIKDYIIADGSHYHFPDGEKSIDFKTLNINNYAKNPIILHNDSVDEPVGFCSNIRKGDNEIIADINLYDSYSTLLESTNLFLSLTGNAKEWRKKKSLANCELLYITLNSKK